MSERAGNQRGVDYCTFIADHPLGQEKVEVVDGEVITASKSRKIHQSFKWNGVVKELKIDPFAPCKIDEFIEEDMTARTAICDRCMRKVETSKAPILEQE